MPTSIERLEELVRRIGPANEYAPGHDQSTRYQGANLVESKGNSYLIREFLRLSYPELPEIKVAGMSNFVLAQCYSGGRAYINGILRSEEIRGRKPRGASRATVINLDDDEVETQSITKLLNQKLGDPDAIPAKAPDPDFEEALQPTHGSFGQKVNAKPNAPVQPQGDVSNYLTAIAKAADAVIVPKFNEARDALAREVRRSVDASKVEVQMSVEGAVDRRWTEAEKFFAQRTRELVVETQQMVVEMAEKLLPRKIQIITSTASRQIDAAIRHRSFDECLRWLLAGQHVYGVGPAGTGKSHMAKQLTEGIGRKFYPMGQALTKYDVTGFTNASGEIVLTACREAMEHGGFLFIDEGDFWAAAALGALNNPLANGWCAFPDKLIEIHPDFICMICANTFGHGATLEYNGRNPLDPASLDRFAYVFINYDEDMERLLYGNGPWVQYVHRVRHAISEITGLRHVISQRAIKRVLDGLNAGQPIETVLFGALWRGLDQDTINTIKHRAGNPPTSKIALISDESEVAGNG